jgi:phenylpropionate dioxygenase-like ring-hydroxylating dioxygenase large terminal subunit
MAQQERSPTPPESEEAPERTWQAIPAEGDGNLYTQSWFPICLSEEVSAGQVLGREFLGGRVAVFRGANGIARVFGAYCVHMGADLAVGSVEGNSLICRFHRWTYNQEGRVVKIGAGDPPPARACLFRFPVVERWGMVWAFNGTTALWNLPELKYPDEELVYSTQYCYGFDGDPWWFAANTLDFNHFEQLHGLDFGGKYPDEEIDWQPYHVKYKVKLKHWQDKHIEFEYGSYGTNVFLSQGIYDGHWYAEVAPRSLPKPLKSDLYLGILTRRADFATEQQHRDFHRRIMELELKFAEQDRVILQTIHLKQGYLTRSDKALARYLDYVRRYPRANPARSFLT